MDDRTGEKLSMIKQPQKTIASLKIRHRADTRRTLVILYTILSLTYLTWRAFFTFSPDAPLYSAVFFMGEVAAIVAGFVFYVHLSAPRRKTEPPEPQTGLSVDVFITTYNEDISLVRTTAVAARDMHYPHKTWILDDGRREAVRELAKKIKVGYITRPTNEHFKAGNQNNALERTDGEFVMTLDADHIPRCDFLIRTLGYFRDDKVAFVQTPQVYYNVDSYQHSLSSRKKRLWHEASVFHHRMQPGASYYNSAFFVGTGAVLRRSALEEVGGFATGSITEDIHTAMRLHSKGWKSVYVDEAVGFMLAADTPLAYLVQRLRWAQGSMQLLRMENPLFVRGLSLWQRFSYLNAMVVYLFSYQHLLFYLAPAFYLLLGMSPIAVEQKGIVAVFIGYIAISHLTYKAMAAPHGRLFFSEIFRLINLSAFILASLTFIEPQGLRFRVTPKGNHGGLPWPFLAAPVILLLVNLTAAGTGIYCVLMQTEIHPEALMLATGFATYFALVSAISLMHTIERRNADEPFAFPVNLDVVLEADGKRQKAVIESLNKSYAFVRFSTNALPGTSMQMDIPALSLGQLPVQIVGVTPDKKILEIPVVKLSINHLSGMDHDILDRYFFETAIPQFFSRFIDAPPGPAPKINHFHLQPAANENEKNNENQNENLLLVRGGML
jgi:cellulose synthase (UDP-forming)